MNHLLVDRRKALGLSQQDLAQAAGISIASVYNFEHGYRPKRTTDTQKHLAAVVGMRVAELWPVQTTSESARRLEAATTADPVPRTPELIADDGISI